MTRFLILTTIIALYSACAHKTSTSGTSSPSVTTFPRGEIPQSLTLDKLAKYMREEGIIATKKQPIFDGYEEISKKSIHKKVRGKKPEWYASPKNDFDYCAKEVCDTYPNTCYYDCYIITNRLKDYLENTDRSEEFRRICNNLPDTFPYEVDISQNICLN